MATAIAVVSILVMLVAGITAVWLTDEVRVFPLVMLPAVVATMLTLSFYEWRKMLTPERRARQDDRQVGREIA